MKKTTTFLAIMFIIFVFTNRLHAQEYYEQLNTVIISGHDNGNAQTFTWVNAELIEKEYFKFRSEIKNAKIEDIQVAFPQEDDTKIVSKADYLKNLRKAGNRSKNVQEFIEFMRSHFDAFPSVSINDEQLLELYKVIRSNTLEGKLDTIKLSLALY